MNTAHGPAALRCTETFPFNHDARPFHGVLAAPSLRTVAALAQGPPHRVPGTIRPAVTSHGRQPRGFIKHAAESIRSRPVKSRITARTM